MSETADKKWVFRELCSSDMFPMFNIINKIGFKEIREVLNRDDIIAIAKNSKSKGDAELNVGIDLTFKLAGVIISNMPACETDIYKLLSSTSNLNIEQIRGLSMAGFAEMIIDFIKKPDFSDFFKVVSKLFS